MERQSLFESHRLSRWFTYIELDHAKIKAIPSPLRGEGQEEGDKNNALSNPPPLPAGERGLTGQQ